MLKSLLSKERRPKLVLLSVLALFGLTLATFMGAEEMGRAPIDVDEQGPNGQHMIFWKIQGLKFDEVEAFLDAGVDVDIRGFQDMTPVIWAALGNDWDMVLLLEKRGADLTVASRDGITVCSLQEGLPTRLDTENGRALEEVRRILQERELC